MIPLRFPHKLTIERATAGAVDDYNQPSQTYSAASTVDGWVQPLNERELAQVNQGGPVVSDHRIFMLPTADVTEKDRVRFNPDDGRRFEVTSKLDPGGLGRYIKLMARKVAV